MIGRIPLEEARPGDSLLWKKGGGLATFLAWLIHILKEPDWKDRWAWHTTPIVRPDTIVDAQFPHVKLSLISDYLKKGHECRAYRTFETKPSQIVLENFIRAHVGKHYDWKVYLFTTAAKLFRPFIDVPRIIDLSYDCWEVEWNFLCKFHFEAIDNSNFDYDYPWLPDFLRCMRELPLKKGAA